MKNFEYGTPYCTNCKFMQMYNYRKKMYYCDNSDRIDDMGKLGTEIPPETSPEWCPVRKCGR